LVDIEFWLLILYWFKLNSGNALLCCPLYGAMFILLVQELS